VLDYADTSVVCNTNYCYSIETHHNDGSISRSNQVCIDAFSTDIPQAVNDISANIIDDEILWSWLTPPNEQVQVYDIFNEMGGLLGSTSLNTISTLFPADPEVCIKVQLTNICDNSSVLSPTVCPLMVNNSLNGNGSVTLTWLDFTGWQNGVNNYSVVIYDNDMVMIDSIAVGNLTEYIDPLPTDNNQVNYYRIWAVANDVSNETSRSNIIRVERPPVIAVPSSFTPNGDSLNDVFVVAGKYIKSVDLSILNRWGSTIFQVNGSSWDGTANGNQVPLGTYVYHIIIKDFANNEHIRTGTVLILKD
jgi:gliding motility-associated-like protein